MEELIAQLKKDEGFRHSQYKDTLGHSTIGYGTKLPLTAGEAKFISDIRYISEAEGEYLLKVRLTKNSNSLLQLRPFIATLPEKKKFILFNMAYQLGANGVVNFKKMITALAERDYQTAAIEMRDSKWYTQAPNRAEALAKEMEK
jgi:lysozyme